jgi:FOG: GGDEF domain
MTSDAVQAQDRAWQPWSGRSPWLNRSLAEDALAEAASQGGAILALIFVVNQVEHIRDEFGDEAVSRLLREFAGRLRQRLPAHVPLHRWTSSSFLVVLPEGRLEMPRAWDGAFCQPEPFEILLNAPPARDSRVTVTSTAGVLVSRQLPSPALLAQSLDDFAARHAVS